MNFISVIDIIGTYAFAISGIRLASAKHFDLFGAFVVGLVTAVGGGTLRDLLLGVPPFWMSDISYLLVTGIALVSVIFFSKYLVHLNNTIFIFDAIGLGLFVVVGIESSIACGQDMWVVVVMGMITGTAGGVMRDILINEIPLIFRSEIYALACLLGGLVYVILISYTMLPLIVVQIISALTIIIIRILVAYFHISLPTLGKKSE
ncbi:MAG: trimeric intracellular cation channel family protein [bacterium]